MKITYIVLAAGQGNNLKPLTLKYPKTSYLLNNGETVLQRTVKMIRKYDENAEIVVVVGHLFSTIKEELNSENVTFINNPFYQITNSIASLWFAKEYLERENVVIIHGDVVFSKEIFETIITQPTKYPFVLLDSSKTEAGYYNAVLNGENVLVMSKQLELCNARYACATKLDPVSSRLLKNEINEMILNNMYDLFYEDALVQMIMFYNFDLFSKDISKYKWSEVNSVDDLIVAKRIQDDD